MKKNLFLALFTLLFTSQLMAQCDTSLYYNVTVILEGDAFASETAVSIYNSDSTYVFKEFNTFSPNEISTFQFCVLKNSCTKVEFYDQFGDGIQLPGGFTIIVNGETIVDHPFFLKSYSYSLGCPKGSSCSNPFVIKEGNYIAPNSHTWYEFKPDSTGNYLITTCDTLHNTCDTKIWIYNTCSQVVDDSTNLGTTYHIDKGCGELAEIQQAMLDEKRTYYLRIWTGKQCPQQVPIHWSIHYNGKIKGCMDSTACNFNPLAQLSDGNCIAQGSPLCTGPDLEISQKDLVHSLGVLDTLIDDACLVNEGCLQGIGKRTLIRFDTKIKNIGKQDYLIGELNGSNQSQFIYDPCHNHLHYQGYAEYLLFTPQGAKLPTSFKNGFCVEDVYCDTISNIKYNCNYMGISAGCEDIYDRYLPCQWVDVTDVPDGNYTLVVRVNWSNKPDAIGQLEGRLDNNWAQACLKLNRSTGKLKLTIDSLNCPAYADCLGVQYGNAVKDCEGTCNGTKLAGDLDHNATQDAADVQNYVKDAVGNEPATLCSDLNGDNKLTIYDAVLLNSCIKYGTGHTHTGGGAHNHCNFPAGFQITTPQNKAYLSIGKYDLQQKYIDVYLRNPYDKLSAYQFQLDGIKVTSVESLVDATLYPATVMASLANNTIVGMSLQDSIIKRSTTAKPLCRVRFSSVTKNQICIQSITNMVNSDKALIGNKIEGTCVTATGTKEVISYSDLNVNLFPNPFNSSTTLSFDNPLEENFELQLFDLSGKLVRTYSNITTDELTIERENLNQGLYVYQLKNETNVVRGKFMIND